MTFLIMLFVILLSMLILLSKCDQASDLLQQLVFTSEIESDRQDIVDWAGSGFLISMLEKLNWFCLTGLINLVLLI